MVLIYLGLPSPAASSGLPAPVHSRSGQDRTGLLLRVAWLPAGRERTLFDLAPREVCLATLVAEDAGGRLLHHFTHHLYPSAWALRSSAGLLSVALAVALPGAERLPVRKHATLRCSDFPHPALECETRRPGTGKSLVEGQFGNRLIKQNFVYDNAAGVFTHHNAVALANFYLLLGRYGKTGSGPPDEGDNGPAVPNAVA